MPALLGTCNRSEVDRCRKIDHSVYFGHLLDPTAASGVSKLLGRIEPELLSEVPVRGVSHYVVHGLAVAGSAMERKRDRTIWVLVRALDEEVTPPLGER
jgi:hypothetical protein